MPVPGEYQRALLQARDRTRLVGAETDRRLVDAFLEALLRLEADLEGGRLTPLRARQLRRQLMELLRSFEESHARLLTLGVTRTIDGVVFQHDQALDRLAREFDTPIVRSFDNVSAAVLARLAQQRGAATFRSLMKYRLEQTVPAAIDALIDGALARGISASELTQDLARVLVNDNATLLARVEELPRGFKGARLGIGEVDWARYGLVDGSEVTALRTVYTDARRIAVSEINNSLREANAEAMVSSPVVLAAKWQTSGRHHREDACDYYATADMYGYGPGYHPPETWPVAPHPNCGCYQGGPVKYRKPSEWSTRKPAPPASRFDEQALAKVGARWTPRSYAVTRSKLRGDVKGVEKAWRERRVA